MKIILTHEVEKLGVPGEVVTVKDGYGRNYLIPRGYAVPWTKGAQRQIDQIAESQRKRQTQDIEEARETREALEAAEVTIAKTAGANGRLFGAVTTSDIAEAASEATGKKIDRRAINVGQHIKSTGDYQATVKLAEDITATLKFSVVADN